MRAFASATAFFHACEGLQGWEGCEQYVAPDAEFIAQSDPVAEFATAREYCDWLAGVGSTALEGASYELHNSAWDEAGRTALFFGTFRASHCGEGGPVPPTQQQTSSHYVYAITMDEHDRVARMTKIWNSHWSLRELGWG